MKPSRLVLAVLLAIASVAFWYLGQPPRSASSTSPDSGSSSAHPGPNLTAHADTNLPVSKVDAAASVPVGGKEKVTHVSNSVSPVAIGDRDMEAAPTTQLPEDRAIEVLHVTIRNFGLRFRGNPVGNNAEITAALNGSNPGGVHFLDPNSTRLNDKGELIDEWGTPYFFHQLSGTEMEIHSAGQDRKMGTGDDLVVH